MSNRSSLGVPATDGSAEPVGGYLAVEGIPEVPNCLTLPAFGDGLDTRFAWIDVSNRSLRASPQRATSAVPEVADSDAAQRSAHGTVEPVHGRVFGDRAAHLIAPRGVGGDLAEKCSGLFAGAHPFRTTVDRADQPPVLGATVLEVDELIRFQGLDKREEFDTLGFNSGEMAGEVLIGSPVEILPESIAADAVSTMA